MTFKLGLHLKNFVVLLFATLMICSARAQPIDDRLDYVVSTENRSLYLFKDASFKIHTTKNGIRTVVAPVIVFAHSEMHLSKNATVFWTTYTSREACLRGRGVTDLNISLKTENVWKHFTDDVDTIKQTWDKNGFAAIDILLFEICQRAIASGQLD